VATRRALSILSTLGLLVALLSAVPAAARPRHPAAAAPAATVTTHRVPSSDSHYCDGCAPPLVYSGGPIANTTGTLGMTIRPIYWIPTTTKQYSSGYMTLINRYITDIAAASGASSNVYSLTPQYYQVVNGVKTNLRYKYTAGAPIIDTQPFPTNGCKLATGFTNCLTDTQLRAELTRLKGVLGLTTNLAYFYPLFTAPTLRTQDSDGSFSAEGFCGYHSAFGAKGSEFVFGNEPYLADGCGEGEYPNANVAADSSISTLSHEIAENVTDPIVDDTGWRDGNGAEIGDICASDYGTPLGSANANDPDNTEYNQVINGHKYYTQTEFSNSAYAKLGVGYGCQQSQLTSGKPHPKPTAAGRLYAEAAPTSSPADGKSKSDVTVFVLNNNGSAAVGDPVNFSEYTAFGTGGCGKLSKVKGKTDSGGRVDTVYTASKSNAICALVAKDGRAGKSTTVFVYQGTYRKRAPTAVDTFPHRVIANGRTVTFTTRFTNMTATPIRHAAVQLDLFPGTSGRTVKARQVSLSYSLTGRHGHFTRIPFTGFRRIGDETIELRVGPAAGATIKAHGTRTVTYHLKIARGALAGTKARDLFHFESYLDQINTAAGTTSTLADTYSTHVKVVPAPKPIDVRGARYVHGAYTVHRGHSYVVAATSTGRAPAYFAATPAPGIPSRLVGHLHYAGVQLGERTWTLRIHLSAAMSGHTFWNVGVRIGSVLHIIRLRVLA